MMTQIRGASNRKAKALLRWDLKWPSWFKLLLRHPTDVLSITHSHRHHTARLICLDDPSHCLASEVVAFFVSHPDNCKNQRPRRISTSIDIIQVRRWLPSTSRSHMLAAQLSCWNSAGCGC